MWYHHFPDLPDPCGQRLLIFYGLSFLPAVKPFSWAQILLTTLTLSGQSNWNIYEKHIFITGFWPQKITFCDDV